MDPARIPSRCEESTIQEAWGIVLGLPAPIDDTDASLLLRHVRRARPTFTEVPVIVATPALPPGEPAPPFWIHQLASRDGRYFSRFGHRFMSAHFVRRDTKYERFETTLKPHVDDWLALYPGAFGRPNATEHPVDRVAFGYLNLFRFDAADFDLSRYFRLSISMGVGPAPGGLVGIGTTFRFFNESEGLGLTVELRVSGPEAAAEGKIRVLTKVTAEYQVQDSVTFADVDRLAMEITRAKDAAKRSFFALTTDETTSLMGAVYAADGP